LELFFNLQKKKVNNKDKKAMRWVAAEFLNYKKIIYEIYEMCNKIIEKLLKNKEFDLNLYQTILPRIVLSKIPKLVTQINESLTSCAVQLNDPAIGYLSYIAMLFIWKSACSKLNIQPNENIKELDKLRTKYYSDFKRIALSLTDYKAAEVICKHISSSFNVMIEQEKRHIFDEFKKDLEQVQNDFVSFKIMEKLDKEYLINPNASSTFSEKINYIQNSETFLSEEIDKLTEEHFHKKIRRNNRNFKKKYEHQIKLIYKSLKSLSKVLENNPQILILNQKDASQSEKLTSKCISRNTNLLKFYKRYKFKGICKILMNDDSNKTSILQGDTSVTLNVDVFKWNKDHDTIKSLFWKELRNNLKKLKFEMDEYSVECLSSFFGYILGHVKEMQNNFEKGLITLQDEEVYGVYQEYLTSAWGCPVKCPFCNKKCESSDPKHTEHHANKTRHYPRVFTGHAQVFGEYRIPCTTTCERISDSALVLSCNGKTLEKFSSLKKKHFDWKISFNESADTCYKDFWDTYKKSFFRFYNLKDLEVPMLNYSKILDRRENVLPEKHIVIFIDVSSSRKMEKKELKSKLKTLLDEFETKKYKRNYFISLLVIESKKSLFETIVNCQSLSNFDRKCLSSRFDKEDLNSELKDLERHFKNSCFYNNSVYTFSEKESSSVKSIKSALSSVDSLRNINYK
jgi:hypothetical protein